MRDSVFDAWPGEPEMALSIIAHKQQKSSGNDESPWLRNLWAESYEVQIIGSKWGEKLTFFQRKYLTLNFTPGIYVVPQRSWGRPQ